MERRGWDYRRWEPSRSLARILCSVFAFVGVLPLLGTVLVSSAPVRAWAARETRRILEEELGVTASYEVSMQLWPLRLAVQHLTLPASDGGSPALEVHEIRVTPQLFPLLAGRLDIGDIDIDQPTIRLVLEDGHPTNFVYRLKQRSGPEKSIERAPFASLALTDANLDVRLDGTRVVANLADIDVFADEGLTFDVALNVTEARVTDTHRGRDGGTFSSEDTLCEINARARLKPDDAFIQRLALDGVADTESAGSGKSPCENRSPEKLLRVRLSDVRLVAPSSENPVVDGHVAVALPLGIVNRYVNMPRWSGFASFTGQVRYDKSTRLPSVQGSLKGQNIAIDAYRFAERLELDLILRRDVIHIPTLKLHFADGDSIIRHTKIEPFKQGVPISSENLDGTGMQFEALMRDVDVTPKTIVKWSLDKTIVSDISGTLSPLHIDGKLSAQTSGFEIFDRGFQDPARRHIIGVKQATIRTRIGVRPGSLDFYDSRIDFGASTLHAPLVSIGFKNEISLEVAESKLDLADVTPLIDIPMRGLAKLKVSMNGPMKRAPLTGNLAIDGFEFGGFPIGTIHDSRVRFVPLKLELFEVRAQKDESRFGSARTLIEFDTDASVVVSGDVKSQSFDLRDFFEIWHFDEDPRFEEIHGASSVDARVYYAIGGKTDTCKTGVLRVDGSMNLARATLYEEHYTGGSADFNFHWKDMDASFRGFELDLPALTLRKGEGALQGSLTVRQGAKLQGRFAASSVPFDQLDALPTLLKSAVGRAHGTAEVYGTLAELGARAEVRISPTRIGSATLPAGALNVELKPTPRPEKVLRTSRCGNLVTPPFSPEEYARDLEQGVFHINGRLFGEQIRLGDFRVTRQTKRHLAGDVAFQNLDLGTLGGLRPSLEEQRFAGSLSGKLSIADALVDDLGAGRGRFELESLEAKRNRVRVRVTAQKPVTLAERTLALPNLLMEVTTPQGQDAAFDLRGAISDVGRHNHLDLGLVMHDLDLGAVAGIVPLAQRAEGRLMGHLQVLGSLKAPQYQGGFELEAGEVQLRGYSAPLSNLALQIAVSNNEIKLTRGEARLGAGTLRLEGSAPLDGFSLGTLELRLRAENVAFEPEPGVRARLDADLLAEWKAAVDADRERTIPKITGTVDLHAFEYTRPVRMTADLTTLTQRGRRTEFEVFNVEDDKLAFDILLRSQKPLVIDSNLIQAKLLVSPQGLNLAGTNQRFGARGDLSIQPGGRIALRQTEFEITDGRVRFDDLTRLSPEVDVTAVTEYRRYSESVDSSGDSGSSAGSGTATATSATGGYWRITMHAYGDAEELKIDLKSDPMLAKDDIFLLLTAGLTRAELDQARSASVGGGVALEALGTLSGADRAVTEAVPLIDDFRFGSTYSSRKGRTEPTITIGKRLADRIRANVTTGLADSREVRSNVEWRLGSQVSVEGSYDNVNDVSSSSLGNVGADILWRLEFE